MGTLIDNSNLNRPYSLNKITPSVVINPPLLVIVLVFSYFSRHRCFRFNVCSRAVFYSHYSSFLPPLVFPLTSPANPFEASKKLFFDAVSIFTGRALNFFLLRVDVLHERWLACSHRSLHCSMVHSLSFPGYSKGVGRSVRCNSGAWCRHTAAMYPIYPLCRGS